MSGVSPHSDSFVGLNTGVLRLLFSIGSPRFSLIFAQFNGSHDHIVPGPQLAPEAGVAQQMRHLIKGETLMVAGKSVEVRHVLEEAAAAFQRCLQALASQPLQQPMPASVCKQETASTFARAGRTVMVRSCWTGEGPLLFVLGDDHDSKAYAFTELEGLRMFRRQLEDFLIETGWSSLRPDDEENQTN